MAHIKSKTTISYITLLYRQLVLHIDPFIANNNISICIYSYKLIANHCSCDRYFYFYTVA